MLMDVKTILLVEDNLADIRLIQEAFKSTAAQVEVVVVRDGIAAMSYLRHEGEYLTRHRSGSASYAHLQLQSR